MSNTASIQLRRGTGSQVPGSLLEGELGINVDTGTLFFGTSGSNNSVSSSFTATNLTASRSVKAGEVVSTIISGSLISASQYTGDGSRLTGISTTPFPFTGSAVISGSFIPHGVGPTSNTVIGEDAGRALTAGAIENIMIGKEAGEAQVNGDSNIMIGVKAGEASTNDTRNILIGRKAGGAGTLGNDNIYIGYEAGRDATSAFNNIGIGYQALFESNNGANSNIGFGTKAGYNLTTGDFNILIGHNAGQEITTGGSNIIIGSGSLGTSAISNQLRIGHGLRSDVLISGSLTDGDVMFKRHVLQQQGIQFAERGFDEKYDHGLRASRATTGSVGFAGTQGYVGIYFAPPHVWPQVGASGTRFLIKTPHAQSSSVMSTGNDMFYLNVPVPYGYDFIGSRVFTSSPGQDYMAFISTPATSSRTRVGNMRTEGQENMMSGTGLPERNYQNRSVFSVLVPEELSALNGRAGAYVELEVPLGLNVELYGATLIYSPRIT